MQDAMRHGPRTSLPQVRLADYGAQHPSLPRILTPADLLEGVARGALPALLALARLAQALPPSSPFRMELTRSSSNSGSRDSWYLLLHWLLEQELPAAAGGDSHPDNIAVLISTDGSPELSIADPQGVNHLGMAGGAADGGPAAAAQPVPSWLLAAQALVHLLMHCCGPLPQQLAPRMVQVATRLLHHASKLHQQQQQQEEEGGEDREQGGPKKQQGQAQVEEQRREADHEGQGGMEVEGAANQQPRGGQQVAQGTEQHHQQPQLVLLQQHVALLFQQLLSRMLSLSRCSEALMDSSEFVGELLSLAASGAGPSVVAVSQAAMAAAAGSGGGLSSCWPVAASRLGSRKRRMLGADPASSSSNSSSSWCRVTYYQAAVGLVLALGGTNLVTSNPGGWLAALQLFSSGSWAGGAVLAVAALYDTGLQLLLGQQQQQGGRHCPQVPDALAAAAAGAKAAAARRDAAAAAAYAVVLSAWAQGRGEQQGQGGAAATPDGLRQGHPWAALQPAAEAVLPVSLPVVTAPGAGTSAQGGGAGGTYADILTAGHHVAACLLLHHQQLADLGGWPLLAHLCTSIKEVAADLPCWSTPQQVAAAMLTAISMASDNAVLVAGQHILAAAGQGLSKPRVGCEQPVEVPGAQVIHQRMQAWRDVVSELLVHPAGRLWVAGAGQRIHVSLQLLLEVMASDTAALACCWQHLMEDPAARRVWLAGMGDRDNCTTHYAMLGTVLAALPPQQVLRVPGVVAALGASLLCQADKEGGSKGDKPATRVLGRLLRHQDAALEQGGEQQQHWVGDHPQHQEEEAGGAGVAVLLDAYPELLNSLAQAAACQAGGRGVLWSILEPQVPARPEQEAAAAVQQRAAAVALLASSPSYMALFPVACAAPGGTRSERAEREQQLAMLAQRPAYRQLLAQQPGLYLHPLLQLQLQPAGDWSDLPAMPWPCMAVLTALPTEPVFALLRGALGADGDAVVEGALAALVELHKSRRQQMVQAVRGMVRDASRVGELQQMEVALQQVIVGAAQAGVEGRRDGAHPPGGAHEGGL